MVAAVVWSPYLGRSVDVSQDGGTWNKEEWLILRSLSRKRENNRKESHHNRLLLETIEHHIEKTKEHLPMHGPMG